MRHSIRTFAVAIALMAAPVTALSESQLDPGQPDIVGEYMAGRAAPSDYPAILQACRSRALAGDAVGSTCLGYMYAHGHGAPLDQAQAIVWWKKAASKGNIRAENALGSMYEFGHGVPIDCAKAARWYNLTADQGSPWGMYYIGVMSVQKCLQIDDVQGLAWLNIALQRFPADAQQIPSALALKSELSARMNDSQRARADLLAQDFQPSVHYPTAALSVLEVLPTDNASTVCSNTHGPASSYYPDQAQRQGVGGRALIACKISISGAPTRCTWTEETPPEYGFGLAATKIACTIRFDRPDTVTADEWVAASPIRFTPPPP